MSGQRVAVIGAFSTPDGDGEQTERFDGAIIATTAKPALAMFPQMDANHRTLYESARYRGLVTDEREIVRCAAGLGVERGAMVAKAPVAFGQLRNGAPGRVGVSGDSHREARDDPARRGAPLVDAVDCGL